MLQDKNQASGSQLECAWVSATYDVVASRRSRFFRLPASGFSLILIALKDAYTASIHVEPGEAESTSIE